MRSLAGALPVALLLAPVGLGAAAVPATAAPASTAGACRDASGVSVVVDFRDLGGAVVVRCVAGPLDRGTTGLEVLRGAGFDVEGTARWGDAFVCRIQGRPAADEALSFAGEDSYHERCQDTPPALAYWTYWYAGDEKEWTYSTESAASREAVAGSFEGWAFRLDETDPPPPAYTPDRPAAPPTTTAPPSSPAPTATASQGPAAPPTTAPGRSSPTAPPTPSTTAPAPTTAPPPTTRPTTAPPRTHGPRKQPSASPSPDRLRPSRPPRGTPGGGRNVVVTGAVPRSPETDSAPTGTLVTGGVLLALGAVAGATWWRRRHDET